MDTRSLLSPDAAMYLLAAVVVPIIVAIVTLVLIAPHSHHPDQED